MIDLIVHLTMNCCEEPEPAVEDGWLYCDKCETTIAPAEQGAGIVTSFTIDKLT